MSALAYTLYNMIQAPALVFALPMAAGRAPGKRWGLARQRLGLESPRIEPGGLWVHALSVGEVISARPLLKELRRRRPELRLWLSASTATGLKLAQEEKEAGRVDETFLFPLDTIPAMGRLLARLRPRGVVIVETDIWPNFLRACRRRDAPVALVNFRISPSRHRTHRLLRGFFRTVYSQLNLIALPSELDARRLSILGLDKAVRVQLTGSLKYDQAPPAPMEPAEWGLEPGQPVLAAGSTHRGEEKIFLNAFVKLRSQFPTLALILAPRDRERFENVAGLVRSRGLGLARLSLGERFEPERPVLLADSIGQLGRLYSLAQVAFVGGSLVNQGGHNPLEPAAAGRPVLFGPYMEDFLAEAMRLIESGGGRLVRGREELEPAIRRLLYQPGTAESMGRAASQVFLSHQGAAGRTAGLVMEAFGI